MAPWARGRALRPDLGRDLGAVAATAGTRRAGRRTASRAGHRRHRRGPDVTGHATRPPTARAATTRISVEVNGCAERLDGGAESGACQPPRAPLFIVNPIAGSGRAHQPRPANRGLAGRAAHRGAPARDARAGACRAPGGRGHRPGARPRDRGRRRRHHPGGDQRPAGLGRRDRRRSTGLRPRARRRGNDLARSVDLPIDPMACLTVALGEHDPTPSTWGEPRTTARSALLRGRRRDVGFDAAVAYTMAGPSARLERGEAGYFLRTLNELRRYKNRSLSLRLTLIDDRRAPGRRPAVPVRRLRQRAVLRRRHADLPECRDR